MSVRRRLEAVHSRVARSDAGISKLNDEDLAQRILWLAGDDKHHKGKHAIGYVIGRYGRRDDWDEGQHPRAADGKFGAGGGSGGGRERTGHANLGKATSQQADEWGNHHFREWHGSLSGPEREAIKAYTANGNEFRSMQRHLRGMAPPEQAIAPEKLAPTIEHLDKALSRARLAEDVEVYRGAVGMPVPKVGSVFRDKGYTSTSVREESTKAYINQAKGDKVFYKITLAKGSRAGYVSSLGPNPQDNEILLPRGSTFSVTKVTEIAPGHHEVEMRLVQD